MVTVFRLIRDLPNIINHKFIKSLNSTFGVPSYLIPQRLEPEQSSTTTYKDVFSISGRRKFRGKFPKIIKKMKRRAEQLLIIFPSTGEDHVCANLDHIDRGLEFCNKWRESVGLPHLNRQLREIIP